jgi:succinate-semialdehyde dehydrogenase/glutarate-semialdehyde dehydrogenase
LVLKRWNDLILAHQDDLGALISREQGKPLAEGRGEVAYGASNIAWFAEEATRANGDVIAAPVPGRRMFALKEPVGVVAAITPWNFPAAMAGTTSRRPCSPAPMRQWRAPAKRPSARSCR